MASELDELRAEVRRRQRAANNKISRLRANGIELSGTDYDVRRNAKLIGRYNRNQLNSYLGKLNAFNSRANSFVGGAEGAPIPRRVWSQYRKAEAKNNKQVMARLQRLSKTIIPGLGQSPLDLDQMRAPTRKGMRGVGANKVMRTVKREPRNVTGADAVAKLIKDFERRASPKVQKKLLRQSRRNALSLLGAMGADDLVNRIKKLDDSRLRILVEDTGFMEDAAQHYSGVLESDNDAITDGLSENKYADLLETIEWAEALSDEETGTRKRRR